MQNNPVVGSESIRVHTATSGNEAATAMEMELLTNYVGSVLCVVHTLALVVEDVFKPETEWQKLMNVVNKTTIYFRNHPKANMMFSRDKKAEGTKKNRIQP